MSTPPQVFISYSHDSDEHADRVLALADHLRLNGIDVILDQYVDPAPAEGWPHWMEANLDAADFVLMICTETYHRRVVRREKPGQGKGVAWEGNLIYNRLYGNLSQGARYIPILLADADAAFIPTPVQGHQHYRLQQFDLSDRQYEALYRHLTGRHATPMPELGQQQELPTRPRPGLKQDPP